MQPAPRHIPVILGLCLAAATAVAALAAARPPAAPATGCSPDTFEGVRYTVCRFDMKTADVRVFWGEAGGDPYRTFGALDRALAGQGLRLAFAINGGMYRQDWTAVGLLVENGVQRRAINQSRAPSRPTPNFYRLPNGVFFIPRGGGRAAVMSTERFVKEKPRVDFATQSGPMLVIDGKLHPAFRAGSTDLTERSGVGVVGDATVVFAISDGWVNFDQFARLFRDRLGARNALFLDGGTAPGIYAPELGRNDPPGHGGYGPMIAVVQKAS